MDHLDNKRNLLSDDMGAWKNNGVDTTTICVSLSESEVHSVEKCDVDDASRVPTYSIKAAFTRICFQSKPNTFLSVLASRLHQNDENAYLKRRLLNPET